MDVLVADHNDGLSDYGSDFSPDEEVILNGLLQQVPDQGDNPNTDPDQQLKDIEGNEGPSGVRVPRRLGREQHANHHPPQTPEKRRVTIQFDGDTTPTKNGMSRVASATSTN